MGPQLHGAGWVERERDVCAPGDGEEQFSVGVIACNKYNAGRSPGLQLRRGHAEFSLAPFARLRRFGIPLHSKCSLNLSKESVVSFSSAEVPYSRATDSYCPTGAGELGGE